MADLVPVIAVNSVQAVALAALSVLLGSAAKRRLPLLDRLNVPGPIVGGLAAAALIFALHDRAVNLQIDLSLRDLLQNAFFTTIGLGASLRLFRIGGPQVVSFFAIAAVGAVLQNLLGIGLARGLGLDPLLGIVTGSVALTGGPATAAAFGKRFEEVYGVGGAAELGIAAAMFGITMGGLLGGLVGGRLIEKHGLRSSAPNGRDLGDLSALQADVTARDQASADNIEAKTPWLINTLVWISLCMGLGSLISAWIKAQGVDLPSYIGAMIAAAVVRNLDDRWRIAGLSEERVEMVGDAALALFIAMAMLSLQLWRLVELAVPLMILLGAQLALVWAMCVWLAFRAMGRDYESAVMAGGFCGFMLGTTANAMACMTVLTQKYGPAPRAFLVVPLVGASLIDFANAVLIHEMAAGVRALGW